jgi:tetratricopeptide (TPR) repeat protein
MRALPLRLVARAAAAAALLTALLGLPRPATADTLLLTDGRTVEAPKAEKQADGSWVLKFVNGDVTLPAALVKDAWLLGAQGYEPRNEDEKVKLEKGLVPYEGKWIPKGERDAKTAKKAAEAKKRIEEAKAHREWRNRYKAKSANFEIEYTIPPEIAKGYIDRLEAFYSTYSKEFKVTKPKQRLKVCFYHDYETFLEVSGAPYGALAYYRFVAPLELNLFYDRLRPEETTAVMFHEAQHYVAHMMNMKFDMPHQMGEGSSEYYGGCKWDPVKKQMITGGVQEGRLTEVQTDIQKGERKSLEDYLNGKLDYDDYTWGWTFIHFMMETPKYAAKFKKFYISLPEAKDIDRCPAGNDMVTVDAPSLVRAFKKYMGVEDLKALEKEWHDYIDTKLKITSVVGFEEAAFAASSTGRMLRAKRLFGEAVDKGSTNPVVYLRYGEMIQGEDRSKAEAMFRKGLTLDPLNVDLWTQLGRLVRNKSGEGNEEAGKKLIQLAMEIDPDSVDTWLLMEEALEKTGPPPAPKPGEGDKGN